MPLNDEILSMITTHYLESGDYNGLPIHRICMKFRITLTQAAEEIKSIIDSGKAAFVWENNFHIRMFADNQIPDQIQALRTDPATGCVYPTRTQLESVVNKSDY